MPGIMSEGSSAGSAPGVEHTQETDLCAKMLRIGGDLLQRRGTRLE